MSRSLGGVSSRGSLRRIQRARFKLNEPPRWWSASRFQSAPMGALATRATPPRSPGPWLGLKTAQRPTPAKGRKSPGPKYCFPTRERDRSRNDHVPTLRSMLRFPQRYSVMKPIKLMPPKLIPILNSSGSEEERLSALAPCVDGRTRKIRPISRGVSQRIVEEEYRHPRPRCQAGGRPGPFRALTVALLIGSWLSGCAPGDHPDRLPGSLPSEVLSLINPEVVRVLSVGPGTAYFGLRASQGPWAIHLLRVDLGRCDLGLEVLRAPDQEEIPGGRSRVTEMFEGAVDRVVAAVNGDFFTPEGFPVGTEVARGEVRTVRGRPALAWQPGGVPWMGTPTAEGDSIVQVGWRISRQAADGTSQVVGGFPLLLLGGGRVGDLRVGENPSFAAARHPRTAVGFDPESQQLWLVGVDGRQAGYSDGMSLPELTSLLETLGVTEAVNLDGGGSTIMVVEGVPVSRPSDADGERPVVNALAVVRDPNLCRFASPVR